MSLLCEGTVCFTFYTFAFQSGMTPLQQAAFKAHREICELLLARGADVNSNYHDSGYTALMFSALSGKEINKTPHFIFCLHLL